MNQPISAMYFISMNSTKRPCLVFTDEPWGNRSIGPSSFTFLHFTFYILFLRVCVRVCMCSLFLRVIWAEQTLPWPPSEEAPDPGRKPLLPPPSIRSLRLRMTLDPNAMSDRRKEEKHFKMCSPWHLLLVTSLWRTTIEENKKRTAWMEFQSNLIVQPNSST